MTRTLILACSATKRADPGELPAIERYDGPAFRTLRANRPPEIQRGRVWILSAKHGLINELEPIENYDDRMTAARAAVLAPKVSDELITLARRGVIGSEIFLVAGGAYRDCVRRGLFDVPLLERIRFSNGGIGEQLAQLKAWLRRDTQ